MSGRGAPAGGRGAATFRGVASLVAIGPPRQVNTTYGARKGAVEAITLTLARELRGQDITGNAVAPGPTATVPAPGSSRSSA